MENKKTVEEIRNEIKSLEEQKFELKYGLTKEGYNKLKTAIKSEIELERIRSQMFKRESSYSSHSFSSFKIDRMDNSIDSLKCKVKDLQDTNKFVCGCLISLGIGVIIALFI